MEELVKALDSELEYVRHEFIGEMINIHVASTRKEPRCPYCGFASERVHSHYERRFKDLPIQGIKVEIVIKNRKMFCLNKECSHKTFAESFECLAFKGKRSRRLTEEILKIALEVSSVTASKLLRKGIAEVGKSTICDLLKKTGIRSEKGRSEKSLHR